MKLLQVENLTKVYKNGFVANDQLNLELSTNEIVGIVGPNGAGKTTLIRQLLRLLKPTSGEIKLLEENIPYLENIAYVPQLPIFFPALTVKETLYYSLRYRGYSKKEIEEKMNWVMEDIGLNQVQDKYGYTLSGGYKKLLLVATAIMQETKILILDEPTAMVDIIKKQNIWDLVQKNKNNRGTLITSHDINEVKRLCDRIYVLVGGKFIFSGTPDELAYMMPEKVEVYLKIKSEEIKFEKFISSLNVEYEKMEHRTFKLLFSQLGEAVSRLSGIEEHFSIISLKVEYPCLESRVMNLVKSN
ncbi:ABC transporter ATP-binding protein [Alkaliphilus transvaalensis]|uniref:ABC transporter ATP-binding protein n=1 Tax=Alkaliphilus transvaalensis TaxID=114628 RepID=UPI0004787417|nr:ABC transporter ATP-binding protein [Alkaliphilus transvaalensis]